VAALLLPAAGLVDLALLVVAGGVVTWLVRRAVAVSHASAAADRARLADEVTGLVEGAESLLVWGPPTARFGGPTRRAGGWNAASPRRPDGPRWDGPPSRSRSGWPWSPAWTWSGGRSPSAR
jgi:hypothetical protein